MIKYAQKTGKSCSYCHAKIGGSGKLTKAGIRFRGNGYVLCEAKPAFPNWKSGALLLITFVVLGTGVFIFIKKRRSKNNT
jgi:hypothetical protein